MSVKMFVVFCVSTTL